MNWLVKEEPHYSFDDLGDRIFFYHTGDREEWCKSWPINGGAPGLGLSIANPFSALTTYRVSVLAAIYRRCVYRDSRHGASEIRLRRASARGPRHCERMLDMRLSRRPLLGALILSFLVCLRVAPAMAQRQEIDLKLLKGAWTTGGPSFDWVISDKTILFENDMQEHPYRLEGTVIVIDYADSTLMQRQRIVRLNADELEIKEERFGGTTIFRRIKPG